MRPDRFGQSPAHEFMESRGRERQHAYDGDSDTARPAISVTIHLTAFCVPPSTVAFPDVGAGDWSAWLLYRRADFSESYRVFTPGESTVARAGTFEASRFVNLYSASAQTDPAGVYDFTQRTPWDTITGQAADQVINTWFKYIASRSETSVNWHAIANLANPDVGDHIQTLSEPIPVDEWILFARRLLDALVEFPTFASGGVADWTLRFDGAQTPLEPPSEPVMLQPETTLVNGVPTLRWRFGDFYLEGGPSGGSDNIRASSELRQFAGAAWPMPFALMQADPDRYKAWGVGISGRRFEIRFTKCLHPIRDQANAVHFWTLEQPLSFAPLGTELECAAGVRQEVILPEAGFLVDRLHTALRRVESPIIHYRHQLPTTWAPSVRPVYGIGSTCTTL